MLSCMVDHLCGLSTHWNNIPLWYLSEDCPLVEVWGFIIFECHLVARSEQLFGRNQISSFVKLLASSLVLVKVYRLVDKGPSSCSLVMVRAYWLDDKDTTSCSLVLIRVYWSDDKALTSASHQYEPGCIS